MSSIGADGNKPLRKISHILSIILTLVVAVNFAIDIFSGGFTFSMPNLCLFALFALMGVLLIFFLLGMFESFLDLFGFLGTYLGMALVDALAAALTYPWGVENLTSYWEFYVACFGALVIIFLIVAMVLEKTIK